MTPTASCETAPDVSQRESRQLLRPREVLEILRVSRSTLHRWASSGRLRPVLLPTGGKRQFRRYRLADVLQMLEASASD